MKRNSTLMIAVLVLLVGAIAVFLLTSSDDAANTNTAATTNNSNSSLKTIVETAQSTGTFTTLVTAVQEAGLVDTLSGTGPFTVFAPTDAAFATLPEGTLDTLLANPDLLSDVLTYHVVSGSVSAADVVNLTSAKTVQGESLTIDTSDGVKVGTAMVTNTDIRASNGIIHVIDSVLVPESVSAELAKLDSQTIVEIAQNAGTFNTLVTALQTAGLVETLSGTGPFTVFAPTDAAFAKLGQDTIDELLNDVPRLTKILTYHVVSGKVMAADVVTLESAKTLEGSTVSIDASNGVRVNESNVTQTDITGSNGVIHVIDAVLIPTE
ncbi:MAG: fasciclin domain-containing protein [Patescibacteria group bacterium]